MWVLVLYCSNSSNNYLIAHADIVIQWKWCVVMSSKYHRVLKAAKEGPVQLHAVLASGVDINSVDPVSLTEVSK